MRSYPFKLWLAERALVGVAPPAIAFNPSFYPRVLIAQECAGIGYSQCVRHHGIDDTLEVISDTAPEDGNQPISPT